MCCIIRIIINEAVNDIGGKFGSALHMVNSIIVPNDRCG